MERYTPETTTQTSEEIEEVNDIETETGIGGETETILNKNLPSVYDPTIEETSNILDLDLFFNSDKKNITLADKVEILNFVYKK